MPHNNRNIGRDIPTWQMNWPNSEQLGDLTTVGWGMGLKFQHEVPISSSVRATAFQKHSRALGRENSSPGTRSQKSFFFFFIFNVIYLCYGHEDRWWKDIRGSTTEPDSEPDTKHIKEAVKWWNAFYRVYSSNQTWYSSSTLVTHSVLSDYYHDYCPSSAIPRCYPAARS